MLVKSVLFVSLAIISSVVATDAPCRHKKPTCINPTVRKEWRALSAQEKASWIKAVNCLSLLPHDPDLTPTVDPSVSLIPSINTTSSYYDDIVYVHMDLNHKIHFTGQFLPWHRTYIHFFERVLKKKCGYSGALPYWDWTIDAPQFYESSFWKDSDPESGLGGWGDPNADFRVTDGGFSSLHLSYPSPHTLQREFTLYPFKYLPSAFQQFVPDLDQAANSSFHASKIAKILETSPGDFRGFQAAFEEFAGPHSCVHLIVGGDLAGNCPTNAPPNCVPGPTWSPNDPLFFLHHAMVDKIWYEWQNRDPENANSFFGGSVQHLESLAAYEQYPNGGPPYLNLSSKIPMDGMFPEVKIGDVMNTTGGVLCYVYE